MSWLRLDDGYASHPKIASLSDREFRVWTRLLLYCARYKTRGKIDPEVAIAEVPGLTPRLIDKFTSRALIDKTDILTIHDWHHYNPHDTNTERQRKARELRPEKAIYSTKKWRETRAKLYERDGGVCCDCGEVTETWNADHEPQLRDLLESGKDPHTLDFLQTRCQSCHSKKTRRQDPRSRTGTSDSGSDIFSDSGVTLRAPARAPVPVPSSSLSQSSSAVRGPAAAASLLEELADTVGWDPPKLVAGRGDDERAVAWMKAAISRDDVRNPGGWSWAGFRSGQWPSEQKEAVDVKGQNLAGQEISHDDVVDHCVGCQEQHPMSVLDKGNGFCPVCVEAANGEAA